MTRILMLLLSLLLHAGPVRAGDGCAVFEIESGQYIFETPIETQE